MYSSGRIISNTHVSIMATFWVFLVSLWVSIIIAVCTALPCSATPTSPSLWVSYARTVAANVPELSMSTSAGSLLTLMRRQQQYTSFTFDYWINNRYCSLPSPPCHPHPANPTYSYTPPWCLPQSPHFNFVLFSLFTNLMYTAQFTTPSITHLYIYTYPNHPPTNPNPLKISPFQFSHTTHVIAEPFQLPLGIYFLYNNAVGKCYKNVGVHLNSGTLLNELQQE